MSLQGPSRADSDTTHELESFLGKAFEEKPLLTGLYENLRDRFFAPHLPPLELTSTPIPVDDRMAIHANPWAFGTSTLVNGGIILFALALGMRTFQQSDPKHSSRPDVDLSELKAVMNDAVAIANGGGGSGTHELTDPNIGRLPRFEENPLTPPQVPLLANPRLPVDSAIAVPLDIKLPDNPSLPLIGVHQSANVTLDSNGQGTWNGIGKGSGGGDGPGKGNGFGPGYDRGAGGEAYTPGRGGVSIPIAIVTPEAEFSDEARRQKFQGVCMISILVDAQGNPQNLHVIRPLGMGLDEKALDAVRHYKFKPAMRGGKPVPVMMAVEVNFRLY